MKRIKSVNRRARTKEWRKHPDKILQAYQALVDEIDHRHAHLRMMDVFDDEREEILGKFPLRLFKGIDLKIGMILHVEVSRNKGIVIFPKIIMEDIPFHFSDELLDMLETLRQQADKVTSIDLYMLQTDREGD